MGSVWDDAFSLRRNGRSSGNWFSPRIRGNTVSCPGGTRMGVTTFVNPMALVFVLVWLAVGLWGANAGNSILFGIRFGAVLVGLPLGMLRFYRESKEARALLWYAVQEAPATACWEPDSTAKVINSKFERGAQPSPRTRSLPALIALVVLLSCGLGVNLYRNRLRDCPAFAASLALVSASPQARAVLGEPIKAGDFFRGVVHQSSEAGYALLSIPVHGSKDKGTLHVVANRVRDHWNLERVALWSGADAIRLDLSPPTQRDSFQYPVHGSVYLVPFDEAAKMAIRELPDYLATRLGIRATILPVLDASPKAIDEVTHQRIAERAFDAMQRIGGQPAEDLDAVFVGVTSTDLRIQGTDWGFATSYLGGRWSILSTARLSEMAWLAGNNPEALPARIRKMVTRNVASLRFPVEPSADPTSALAAIVSSASDADEMGEDFLGEKGSWSPFPVGAPCFSILQGPNGRQSSRVGCSNASPVDSRFEIFENFTDGNLLVMSHTDLTLDRARQVPFVRKYRPKDDRQRSFGIGANNSFDIFPVGDSRTFSSIDLILEDGARVHFDRVSRGTSYADARLRAGTNIGNSFSRSNLVWNGNGWDLTTPAGWIYRFPSSGPGRSPEQSALVRLQTDAGVISLKRDAQGSLQRAESAGGQSIDFTIDAQRRITSARQSSGHSIRYEYDSGGRLVRVQDSEYGEESYQYDFANRLTAVLDSQGRALLLNTYGYMGEIRSQTLADHRTLRYDYGFDEKQQTNMVSFTDENGFVTEWRRGIDGFYATLPRASKP